MKKHISILLVILLMLIFCSCKNNDNENKNISSDVTSTVTANTDSSLISSYDITLAEDTEKLTESAASENKGTTEQTKEKEPVTSTTPVNQTPETDSSVPAKKFDTETTTSTPTNETSQNTVPTYTKPTEAEISKQIIYYINQFRNEEGNDALTPLAGLTKVAKYRSKQIISSFAHDTHDIREANAFYQYGRYIDMTVFGYDEKYNYYEYSGGEAIAKGSWIGTAEQIGKQIVEVFKGSDSHWSYIGSSEYKYAAIGLTYDESSPFKWYVCVIVSETDEFE